MEKRWMKVVYDVEIFRNFFSVTFKDVETKKVTVFEISSRRNDLEALREYILNNKLCLIGYNSRGYDDLIINYLMKGKGFSVTNVVDICAKLYDLSQLIIGTPNKWMSKELKPLLYSKEYTSLDLMLVHRFHKLGIGLKQVAVSMKWHRIQDLPLHYTASITDEHDAILEYNLNDVDITEELLEWSLGEVRLRQSIAKRYGVDTLNSSRPNIGDKLMNKFYSEKSGLEHRYFKDLRDNNTTVHFKDIIWDGIKFETPILQQLHQRLLDTTVVAEKGNKDFKEYVVYGTCGYDIAKGGLHSVKPPLTITATDEYELIDLDFGSFYPSIMINLGIFPPHLGKEFLEVLEMVTKQRLKAKADGDKVTAETLKITINSIYGKLGFEYGYLYSPASMYAVTINGQLMLLNLIEKLEQAGMECFYANTDGATFKVHKSKVEEFYAIGDAYSEYVDIPIEYANYEKCFIRDVNNYIIVDTDGDRKIKGAFSGKPNLQGGFDMPVVAKVAEKVLVDGADIQEELERCAEEDIYDFCKAQKVGGQFTVERHYLDRETNTLGVEKMQKTNRYYVSNVGSKLYKVKPNKNAGKIVIVDDWTPNARSVKVADVSHHDLVAGYSINIFNDYFNKSDYDINYGYYSKEVRKLIRPFDQSQLTLF